MAARSLFLCNRLCERCNVVYNDGKVLCGPLEFQRQLELFAIAGQHFELLDHVGNEVIRNQNLQELSQ